MENNWKKNLWLNYNNDDDNNNNNYNNNINNNCTLPKEAFQD